MNLSRKDEAYTFDELEFLKNLTSDSALKTKLAELENAITQKDKMAIFFMPQQSFNIFSVFSQNNSLCEINSSDLETLLKSVEADKKSDENTKNHFLKKITALKNFLESGNKVSAVAIQMDA